MKRYDPVTIEPKWQKKWDETQVYKANLASDRPKYIGMSMFNYPSGAGIHIGHAMNYTISDVMARYKRQQGYESYHPVGWDAFGLPAENYAIKSGVSPQASMAEIIPSYHAQYKAMGWSNDWSKEIATCDPVYYKWTQWIFSQMYRNGLAYQDARQQWWCDKCQTVLANEQVINDKCWRHDGADDPDVTKKEVKQWFFKITDYADELLEATDALDWTESVKLAQKNWIGRSVGAEIEFAVEPAESKAQPNSELQTPNSKITVFTTRPDTIYGATFLVLAPEHELVDGLTTQEKRDEVEAYKTEAAKKSELERQESKEKTGVFTGSYAINPINDEKVPIWIADYVLTGYGTGAIMAVPAHDERDHEFAKKFNLPIIYVIEPTAGQAQGDDTHKDSIFVALRNPQKDEVVVLDWGPRQERHGGNMLIGGGLEGNEPPEEAALREITEETGYTDVKLVKKSEFKGHGYFFSNTKNKNMHVSGHGLLFDLVSDRTTDQNLDEGEKDKFNVTWQPIEKVASVLDDKIHETMYRWLVLDECYTGEGVLTNSGAFDGVSSAEARELIVQHLKRVGKATEKTNYKIRDWSVSRQRYWGAPIPIVHCKKDGIVLVPDDQLPVVLPELEDFAPSGDGRSALARATDWLNVKCPSCGGPAERETDTLDTYICSSWYMLRYFDPKNEEKIFDSAVVNKWMPIDFYNGGDHATAHMIYARFVTRFFHRLGLVDSPEPFKKFLFNGKVTASDGTMFSKSKGNGVDPLEIINQGYGADALRTYLMFAAPLDLWIRWDPQGVPGAYRFLSRVWNLVQEFLDKQKTEDEKSGEQAVTVLQVTHRTIKKVTEDIEDQKYNTAIAALMKLTNDLYLLKKDGFVDRTSWQFVLESLVALVAPFAPHMADELWHDLGHDLSVQRDSWPKWDEVYLVSDTVTLAVQINGKVRAEITVEKDASSDDIQKTALVNERVREFMGNKEPKKIIVVLGRIVNIVV